MATLDELEQSIELSRPVELYIFTFGATTHRYTSADDDIVFQAATYTALAGLKKGNVQESREQKSTAVTIQLPTDSVVAEYFLAVQPSSVMNVQILRIQPAATPPTSIVMFEGYVSSVAFEDEQAEMRCVPHNELFTREIPRFQYQGLCNHELYDARCKLSNTSFRYDNTVLGVTDGVQINIQSLPTSGLPYIGGYLELPDGSEQRLIIDQVGTTVTILYPFRQNISGGTIYAYQGCDHTPQTCSLKFSNILNYGGFPFVPTSNPFNLTQITKE